MRDKLSVRQTEEVVKNLKDGKAPTVVPKVKTPDFVKESVQQFSEFFGNKTSVSIAKNGKGKISIPFSSEEDLERIKKLLK